MPEPDLQATARQALTAWDIAAAELVEVSHSENIVFRVRSREGELYVMRLHRPGYHDHAELVSERTWTKALADAGLDVPVAVPTRRGEPYSEVELEGERRYVGLLEWVEGETMRSLIEAERSSLSIATRFRQLGGILAALHNQAAAWEPPAGFSRHAVDADGLVGKAPFWGRFWESPELEESQRAALGRIRARARELLCSLRTEPATFSMIHADLHPGNVVVNGSRLHVIDFDDAAFGWHAYDLAVALWNYQSHEAFGEIRSALIEGYRRERDIEDEVLAHVPLFQLVRALASIGWVSARPELGLRHQVPELCDYVDRHADAVLGRYG